MIPYYEIYNQLDKFRTMSPSPDEATGKTAVVNNLTDTKEVIDFG